jgi:hypothetical protein
LYYESVDRDFCDKICRPILKSSEFRLENYQRNNFD